MRSKLTDLINRTILFECNLPCDTRNIDKTIITAGSDDCYTASDENNLAEIIYNSILEYSYREFDIQEGDQTNMFSHAFGNKFKYNKESTDQAKEKLGVYGEVLLYIILNVIYSAPTLISKGNMYNPLENSEAKGYDSYHLIEQDDKIELWFGEAKFYQSYTDPLKKIFDNLVKVTSDKYFESNLIAISNVKSEINSDNDIIKNILKELNLGNSKPLFDEVKKKNIKLVYPILLAYEKKDKDYNDSIKQVVTYINNKYSSTVLNNTSINVSIFFIFLPLINVKLIKTEIIKWIESKKPLI
jgi:hypothetical protein